MYRGLSLDQAPPEDIPLRFFLTAPIFGVLSGLILTFYAHELVGSRWNLETIAFTHSLTLGWLTMVMIGAFYQMIPVLVGGSVPFVFLSRYVHAFLTMGTLCLLFAFFFSQYISILMILAGVLITVALVLFLVPITISLFQVKANGRPTVFAMRFSVIALTGTLLFGLLFAGDLAGLWNYPISKTIATGIHMVFGLIGWVGMLIVGVGFYVLTMFYLTPVFGNKLAAYILVLMGVSIVGFPITVLFEGDLFLLLISGFPGFIGTILFSSRVYRILAKRKRKAIDATMKFWWFGLAFFPIALLIPWLPISTEKIDTLFGQFFLIGFAVSITSGMLYKIVPFILWFHRFSHKIGKENVPLLRDILPNKRSNQQFICFIVVNISMFLGIVLETIWIVQLSGILLSISFMLVFLNIFSSLRIAQKG